MTDFGKRDRQMFDTFASPDCYFHFCAGWASEWSGQACQECGQTL